MLTVICHKLATKDLYSLVAVASTIFHRAHRNSISILSVQTERRHCIQHGEKNHHLGHYWQLQEGGVSDQRQAEGILWKFHGTVHTSKDWPSFYGTQLIVEIHRMQYAEGVESMILIPRDSKLQAREEVQNENDIFTQMTSNVTPALVQSSDQLNLSRCSVES